MTTQELSANEVVQGLKPSNEIHKIQSSFLQDARAILEIGKNGPDAAGNIAEQIQHHSGVQNSQIKEAVNEEAWKIHDAGDGFENRNKRINKINELALRMGFKIMEKIYPNDSQISEFAYVDEDAFYGLGGTSFSFDLNGTGDEPEDLGLGDVGDSAEGGGAKVLEEGNGNSGGSEDDADLEGLTELVTLEPDTDFKVLKDAIHDNKDDIAKIIESKVGEEQLSDFIVKRADSISSEISFIPRIYKLFQPAFSSGDIKAAVSNILKSDATQIASELVSGNSDKVANQVFDAILKYKNDEPDNENKKKIYLDKIGKAEDKIKNAIEQIKTKIVSMVVQEIIEEQSGPISETIIKIPEISDAIYNLPEGISVSPGITKAIFEYKLVSYATALSKPEHSESLKDYKNCIYSLFEQITNDKRIIDNAKFGLVIAEIIKDNSSEIAGRRSPSADTISGYVEKNVVKEISQGYKRRYFLLLALADSITHNIVRSILDSKILPKSLSNVVSEMKKIIENNAKDIVEYYSAVEDPQSIVSKLLSTVEHITCKINQTFYDLNKSILIQLQQRPIGTSTQYKLKVVQNVGKETPSSPGDGDISVSSFSCLPGSNYICVTHKINLGGVIQETDIGGLRFYLDEKEVETFDTNARDKKSVFYQQGKNEVSVYFHARTVSASESNKRLLDKTPLLFRYNANFYKLLDRDNYVHKWVFIDGIKGSGPEQTEQLTGELDNLNKSLNRIDLDQIATMWDTTQDVDGVSNKCYRKLYGIPHPGKDPPDNRLDKSFYDRVFVWGCVTRNYRKQTHSTLNKSQVVDVYLHGHKLTGINDTQPDHNQVSVYYDHGDHHFSRPLLILLSSQAGQEGEGPSPTQTKTWYKRADLAGTKWQQNSDDTGSYESEDVSALKEKLTEIASGLYTALTIELHEKKGYEKDVSVISGRTDKSTIIVEQKCLPGIPSLQGYRCWEHNLSEYYNNINNALNSQQDGGQALKQTSLELTFVLDVAISGIKVGLFTAQDRVAPVLAYTKADYSSKRSLVVYFCGNDGRPDDPVPLMFNYNGKFYGPLSKDKYFGHWRELNISSPVSSSGTQLKSELDRIYHMLNGIELCQKSSYGLRCCKNHCYYNNKGKELNFKRIIVTSYKNESYKMFVHTTVHTTGIGPIIHSNSEYKFDQHSDKLSGNEINQVALIYSGNGDSTNEPPVLVLLNQANQSAGDGGYASADAIKQSTTHGYYHKKTERGDQPTVYTYHNIESGCKLMAKLMGLSRVEGDGDDCLSEHTQPINDTLSQITGSTMTKDDTSGESEQESLHCKEPCESEFKEPKCDGVHQQEIPDGADLLEVQEEDSESILPCSASSDCETGSEELDGSDSMVSGASPGLQRSKRSKRSHRESTGVEGPEGEPGARGGHWSSSNHEPILSKLVGLDESEIRHKQLDLYCKFIVAFVATASYLIFHILDITSRHFAVAFDIPEHNISIYFAKIYSLRCFCSVIGYVIGYSLYQIGGGDRNGKNEGVKVRKYVGIISFSLLLIVRTAFLAILYISTQLSYHVYMVIFLEGLIYSVHDQALLGLAPNYMSVINFMYYGDRLIILCIQFFLDLWFFKRPLIMIKIQIWICVLLTAPGVGFWWYYNFRLKPELDKSKSSSSESEFKDSEVNPTKNNVALNDGSQNLSTNTIDQDKDGIDAVVVPFIMFLGASMFKDFLYPGTIPYALLHRDKCHTINMCIPIIGNIGSVMNFIIDIYGLFVRWEWYYNLFLFLVIPMVIIFVYSILAIHTRIPSALRIRNSLHRVMAIALTMIFCHGNLEPLSYLAIGKYAARGNDYGFTILAGFQATCLLSRSIFARLSAGYNVIRVSLGYHLPKFRPNHRMSKYNTFFYIVRQTGRRSWVDLKCDFKFDIKNYL